MTVNATYCVVFASDAYDIKIVSVPAFDAEDAREQVLSALGRRWDTAVFESAPTLPSGRYWSLAELEDYYDSE